MSNVFKSRGPELFDNGYEVVPITRIDATDSKGKLLSGAGKAPALKGWQKIEITSDIVNEWATGSRSRCGVGIRTHRNPAVDIDCLDAEASEHMTAFVESEVGFAPIRVGREPKALLLYYTERPFTKVKSTIFVDENGNENAVEILGSGQQFVAYGIHPGTKKPYKWVTKGESPAENQADFDLEEITLEDARKIIAEFDRYAKERGWKPLQSKSGTVIKPSMGYYLDAPEELSDWSDESDFNDDEDDWVTTDDITDKWDGTYEELYEIFENDIEPSYDYHTWIPVLAALKDAEREPDEFKEIARMWSARAEESFDNDAFEDKWENGNFNRVGKYAKTLRGVIAEAEKIQGVREIEDVVIPLFEKATDLAEWTLAADRLRETWAFGLERETAINIACEKYKKVTNGLKLTDVQKKRYLSIDYSLFDAPEWLAPWVYCTTDNEFINLDNRTRMNPKSFANAYNRETVKKFGVAADVFATVERPVPVIHDTMYYPLMHGEMPKNKWKRVQGINDKRVFEYNGLTFLNTFDHRSMPDTATKITTAGYKAIGEVQKYFEIQYPDPDERRHAMDWIAWVINNPVRKINYMLLVLGGQGSGKTIVKKFMEHMLGADNVSTISNKVIHGNFTGWQSGHMLKVIEEISVSGHRYDVMNSLKEPISNETLQIEAKYRDPRQCVNTSSYMAFTNDVGALPLTSSDRRFLLVRSAFQHKREVTEYLRKDPGYFKRFEKAFTKHAPEIRKWFSEWEYSEGFKYDGNAPETVSMESMSLASEDDFTSVVMGAVDDCEKELEFTSGITDEVIFIPSAVDLVRDRSKVPNGKIIYRILAEYGFFRPVDSRTQIRFNDIRGQVVVANRHKWLYPDGSVNVDKIKEHLEENERRVEEQESKRELEETDVF